ncbi:MAG: SGNH/GDSL hydrolase family protein [Chroococcidiopsidaceae cyanobacterium CP_BM_ER_R8_30]|nr:SGNH/GDSL hydrolase family protein [Chroococcidiopsidaceae cyanobacterium CP_BM_ER_R8_30]
MRRGIILVVLALFVLSLTAARVGITDDSFFLHDGDTVVFYGDSITEQQMYGRDIENYVITHYPNWHIKFINSGWGGDYVTGGGGGSIETRLKRDVLPYKPTVVTILLGMNDGEYHAYDEVTFQRFAEGLTHIVDELKQTLPQARLTLLTPSMFDKDVSVKGPAVSTYNDVLIRYGEFIKRLGIKRGICVVNLNAPMVAATLKGRQLDPHFALSADGIHPNEIGHTIIAAAVLSAWHAKPNITDVTLELGKSVTVTPLLLWPLLISSTKAFAVSPLPGSLDVFRVHATKLSAGENYTLVLNGKDIATLTSEQLTNGLDMRQYPQLPMNQQTQEIFQVTEERTEKWHSFFKGEQVGIAAKSDLPTKAEINALLAIDRWLDVWRSKAYNIAQPKPQTFSLR